MATVIKGSDIQGSAFVRGTDVGGERAGRLSGMAREKAVGQLDSAKGQFCSLLSHVAEGLERAGRDAEGVPRQAFEVGSRYVRRACDRINTGSTQELLDDVGEQLRARPAVFLAGLVGLGFLAGRVLRS